MSRTAILAVVFVGACGDPGGPPPTAPVTIGAGGGTITAGGATLVIPPGALAGDTAIAITPATTAAPRALAGTAFTFEPDGLQFAKPARLTLTLDPTVDPTNVKIV